MPMSGHNSGLLPSQSQHYFSLQIFRMSGSTQNYVFTLGPELLKKANKELNEKEKHRKRDIQVLRERVLANKGIC